MTEQQAGEAIAEAWAAGWLALHPGSALPYDTGQAQCVPYALDNEAYDPEVSTLGPLGAWARVSIVPSIAAQGSMGPPGSRQYQTKGYIAVQLFTPAGGGGALLRSLCDDVRTVLQGKSFTAGGGSLPTFAGTTRGTGTSADGRWYQTTVVVPFYYFATQ